MLLHVLTVYLLALYKEWVSLRNVPLILVFKPMQVLPLMSFYLPRHRYWKLFFACIFSEHHTFTGKYSAGAMSPALIQISIRKLVSLNLPEHLKKPFLLISGARTNSTFVLPPPSAPRLCSWCPALPAAGGSVCPSLRRCVQQLERVLADGWGRAGLSLWRLRLKALQ